MRILLSLITLLSFYSCSTTYKSPDIIEYYFLDSITLTDYYISIPAYANCAEINNTETLLACFPELNDVLDTIHSMSESDFKSIKRNPDEYSNYGPDGWHLYHLEVFTDFNKNDDPENLVVRYSLHPKGGTLQIDSGTLTIRCDSENAQVITHPEKVVTIPNQNSESDSSVVRSHCTVDLLNLRFSPEITDNIIDKILKGEEVVVLDTVAKKSMM